MRIREIITEGWNSLVRNRLRSFLTMLGIVWGLVTVVLLLGYGQGVGESVLTAFLGIVLAFHWFRFAMNPAMTTLALIVYASVSSALLIMTLGAMAVFISAV